MHRDIKAANVFLSKNGDVKLGDLNVSAIEVESMMQTQTGTPYQCPPEIWRSEKYDSKCDIWSLGCVIYELTTLNPPFLAKTINKLKETAIKGEYSALPAVFSPNLSQMIRGMIVVDPKLRLSASDLLNHPALLQKQAEMSRSNNSTPS